MTDLKRSIRCSNCGNEATVYIASELEMSELTLAGKCRCGNSMQINYSIVGKESPQAAPQKTSETSDLVNIDESLFTPEIPSDAIRDLMED